MNDQLIKLGQSRWTSAIGSAVLGVGVGVAVGYFLSRKKVQEAVAEVEDIKQVQLELDFERAEKDKEFNLQIQQAALVSRELREHGERFLETVKGLGSGTVEDATPKHVVSDNGDREEPEETPVVTNVFDTAGDEWDYAIELNERRKQSIYVLHIDEFMADEMEWNSQSTLTWYEGDQILCDSKDVPIYDWLSVVGELKFGHGSKDPNVCYIRNERLQAEYEVLRDPGSYETEVLGGQVEERARRADVKHENSPRKFRRE
jgi:hypothetical protein